MEIIWKNDFLFIFRLNVQISVLVQSTVCPCTVLVQPAKPSTTQNQQRFFKLKSYNRKVSPRIFS